VPWGYYAAALDRHVAGVPEDELWRAVEWLHAHQQQEGGGVRRGSVAQLGCILRDECFEPN